MSALARAAEEYLAVRRALGYKLIAQGKLLLQFVDFLDAQDAPVITTALALEWAKQPAGGSPLWWHQRLSVVRGFAQHLQGFDARTEVPASDLLPARFRRAVPYLYSEEEITRLMHTARQMRLALRAATYETLIGLLAVTGMRIGEAIALNREDVDLDQDRLVVRHGKNDHTREIPLHPSTVQALHAYTHRREELCPCPQSLSFLISSAGTRLDKGGVWHAFDWLRRRSGVDRPAPRPRLHDVRHTFVLRTLLRWYQEDSDIEAQLPLLSTFLGHINPSDTYWYFEGAPELLALAAERLERSWEQRP
jgi:integrase/recombinase XerD